MRMRVDTRAGRLLLAASVLLLPLLVTCVGPSSPEKVPPPERVPGALDSILLSDQSEERGPLIFPHHKHYGPKSQGMNGIACGVCHFCEEDPRTNPIRSCRRCHIPHDETADPTKPFT